MRIARPGHAEASSLRGPMARRRVLRRQTTTATVQAIPTTAVLMSRRNVRSVIRRPTTTTAAIRSRARTIRLLRVPTQSHELILRRAAAIPLLHALTPRPAVAIAVVVEVAVAVAAVVVEAAAAAVVVVAVVATVVVAARTAAVAPARTPGTNRLSCVKRPAQTFPAGRLFFGRRLQSSPRERHTSSLSISGGTSPATTLPARKC